MKNVIKFILFALALGTAAGAAAMILKKCTNRLEASDEDIMFIG